MKESRPGITGGIGQGEFHRERTDVYPLIPRPNGEQHWDGTPHEKLVANIKNAIAQERAAREKQGITFDPVMSLISALDTWTDNPATRQRCGDWLVPPRPLLELSLAWEVIAYPYVAKRHHRDYVRESITTKGFHIGDSTTVREGKTTYCIRNITLDPKSAKLLAAMAEAVGISRTRGEFTYDLSVDPDLQPLAHADPLYDPILSRFHITSQPRSGKNDRTNPDRQAATDSSPQQARPAGGNPYPL